LGTCVTFALAHSQHFRLLQDLPVQRIPMILMLHFGVAAMRVASGEFQRASVQAFKHGCPQYARQTKRSSQTPGVVRQEGATTPCQRRDHHCILETVSDELMSYTKSWLLWPQSAGLA
jgi:hypothetical protein